MPPEPVVLAFDTSAAHCAAAVVSGSRILAQRVERMDKGQAERLMLLPDSGYCLVPLQVSHREAFRVEAGWSPYPGRLERLIRRYDTSGAWISATWISAVLD